MSLEQGDFRCSWQEAPVTGFLSFLSYHYFSLRPVSAALGAGYSGRNIRVGVVDSGVDGRHSEFSGRLHAGGDWQSASDGRIDLHGHGTHVAAILGGAQDGVGMHGVTNIGYARALPWFRRPHHIERSRSSLRATFAEMVFSLMPTLTIEQITSRSRNLADNYDETEFSFSISRSY